MSRLDQAGLEQYAIDTLGAKRDDSTGADFTFEKGSLIAVASPDDMKQAFKRIKKVPGYRWVLINKEDLFAANTLSLGSKAGLLAQDGSTLKNADVPRKKV